MIQQNLTLKKENMLFTMFNSIELKSIHETKARG